MSKKIKMNYFASKENLEAAIKQLIRIKEIPLEDFDYYGELIEGCELCNSAKVYDRKDFQNCRNCILQINPQPSFIRMGCFGGLVDNYPLLDTLSDISEKDKCPAMERRAEYLHEELIEAIRFNLPEFITLCESKGVDVPEDLIKLYQIRRML